MSLILNLDTSTAICSAALSKDKNIIASRLDEAGRNHASLLTPFIEELFKETGTSPESLDAISVSKGPGSYTGLRIGVSTAKGMAYALSKPLLAPGTLSIMANGFLKKHPELKGREDVLLCPMIDARRMEVYSSLLTTSMKIFREVKAEIIAPESFSDEFPHYQVWFFGDGAAKCKEVIINVRARFDDEYFISATDMLELSVDLFENGIFEDVAYFEPFYLKDFIATVPKKKII